MKIKEISKSELIKQIISLNHKLNRKPMKRDDNSLNYYAKKLFGSWNNLMKSAGYKVRFYQKINSVKFNEDFAYFLGLLITDGHIYYNNDYKKYKVAIYTSYPEEKEMIIKLIKDLFNYNPGLTSRMHGFSKKPNYEIRIPSKNLAKILINNFEVPSGAKSLIVGVPNKIMKSSPEIKMAFLRGVIDGDGSISSCQIKISSGSIKFLKDLIKLLNSMNISSGSIYNGKNTNTLELKISIKKNIKKLKQIYNTDNFVYLRKKEKIDKI